MVRPFKSVKLVSSKKDPKQVELFELDGVSYTIADRPRVNIAIQTLRVIAEQGQRAGESYMLEALLGKKNYDALLAFDELTITDFEAIIDIAREVVFADLTAPTV